LVATIMDYIAKHNDDPKTFIWTAKIEEILPKSPEHEQSSIRQHQSETLH
jgi:hypothetical protein